MTELPAHRATLRHVPALDGLRGVAVLAVLAFHADGALPGGYLGVDTFFVLSGYLITSLLVSEREKTGRIALASFWMRRARRLFPAVLVLMPLVATYARLFAKPDELGTIRADALSTLAYVQNWHAILSNKSYWELFAAPSPLEHTWSLSIEEQFYVLWPLAVTGLLAASRGNRRALLVTSLLLAVVSAALVPALYDEDSTTRVYYGTDTRGSGLLLGAALSTVFSPGSALSRPASRALDGAGVLAAAGLGVLFAKLGGEEPFLYHGGLLVSEACTVVLILCAANAESVVGKALAFRPLAFVGTISYGLYLFHWPVNCVLSAERLHRGALAVNALRLVVTFAVSYASFRFYERPIRNRGVFFGKPVVVVPGAVALAVASILLGTKERPKPPPPPPPPRPPETAGPRYPGIFDTDVRALPPASALRPGTLRILALGDSVASKLGVALRYRQEEQGTFVAERGVGDCSILEGFSATQVGNQKKQAGNSCSAHWAEDVKELVPDVSFVVLGGAYFQKVNLRGSLHNACQPAFRDVYRARLESLLDDLSRYSKHVVIALVPYPIGRWRSKGLLERVDCFDRLLADVAKARRLPTVDLMSYVCPTADCRITENGEPIRPDGLHFDGAGAEETARFTLREIRRAVLPPEEFAAGSATVPPPAAPSPSASAR
ncbi:MAG TPA: acyltransferase family protein [Polyangiaceae bacterium]|nr:acyltransferase family protein [Polyangiaceae bacterium]